MNKTINTEFNDKPSNSQLGGIPDYYKKIADQKIPTRMFCQICGHLHKIDFWVPDEIWNEAIHPKWRDTHVCINCFMERADERLLEWEKDIKLFPCSMVTQIGIQKEAKFLEL